LWAKITPDFGLAPIFLEPPDRRTPVPGRGDPPLPPLSRHKPAPSRSPAVVSSPFVKNPGWVREKPRPIGPCLRGTTPKEPHNS